MQFFTMLHAFICFLVCVLATEAASNYYGKFLGSLKSYHHGLGGDVYVVDSRTLHIRNFAYDGEGPAGYFYVSNGKAPSATGTKLRDERGSIDPLKRYRKKHITLTLPEGKTINNIKWFYVWCDEFSVNFGDVKIPKNFDFPKPQKISKLTGVHGVSSDNIVVVDAQTLLIPSFSYDGDAPDAKFWVGSSQKPSPQGNRVPDENGKEEPLRKYTKKTIVLTLPGELTVFDIGHFGIWCEAFTVDFGHIQIPKDLNIPPSLKMLGVSPQSKLNCEILHDDLAFEVRWAVAGDSIVIQLVSKLEKGEYMSFGPSGQIDRNSMLGGDVVVAWIDHDTLNGYAYDYYLDSKSQCAGRKGSCPDLKLQANTESIRLLNAAQVNGYSIVTYQRPLRAHDNLDLPIYVNGSQAVIWAIGPLNSANEVSYHSITSKQTILIDFGRSPQWNCPIPESDATVADSENTDNFNEPIVTAPPTKEQNVETSTKIRTTTSEKNEFSAPKSTLKKVEATPAPVKKETPWDIPPIQCFEPEDGIFYAQMGPTGGKRGYSAITGHVGWGISWYINGLLIPVINVVRGRTYTFVVEGGLDPEIPAKYHPFYITDDPVGGYQYKTPEERAKVNIFAGVTQNKAGELIPTGVGRLCNWTPDPDQPSADEFASFGAYQRTLSLVCDHGEPGVVQWTPDENTPDTVYYHCFTHRYLGWKIVVHDSCDKEEAESEQVTTRVRANEDFDRNDELLANPSVNIATRVKATNLSFPYFNDLPLDINHKNEKNNPLLLPIENEFMNERYFLQDPYMPPPPYQKNFDYQSMQTTELVKNSNSEEHNQKLQEQNIRVPFFINNSTTPPSIYKPSVMNKEHHKSLPRKDPYMSNKNAAYTTPSKYQPGMHIHVVKHPEPNNGILPMNKPHSIGKPYRHSVIIKKPIHKIPQPYRMPTKTKQAEHYLASGSIPMKSVMIPLNRNNPLLAQTITHPSPKKQFAYLPQKMKEEVLHKPHILNRVEDLSEHKPGGFNPSSIVIESGFKPILPSTENQQAQDRMDVVEDYTELEPNSTEIIETSSENHSKNPFEGREPELFEPMFIPSPLINEQQRKKKPIPVLKSKHKPNIVYILPHEERNSPSIKEPSYFNYYAENAITGSPIFNDFDKEQSAQTEDGLEFVLSNRKPFPKPEYKVTEYFDVPDVEVSEINNSTEKSVPEETSPKTSESTSENHKIRYIPMTYTFGPSETENNHKFVITVPENVSTESANITVTS